jgi:hypothetical protein
MTLPGSGLFGAIAGRHPSLTIEIAPISHREGSPLALPSRARSSACPRDIDVNTVPDLEGNGISRNQSGRIARNDGPRAVDVS